MIDTKRKRVASLLSVVIPAFNAELSLRRAIQSALDQTYTPLEVIVINDGSTDGTEKIALGFGNSIRYVFQKNQGETASRNKGFSLTDGEFVTFLDHDDYWHPDFAKESVFFLVNHPEVVAVSVGYETQSALKRGKITHPHFLSHPSETMKDPFVIDDFYLFWAIHDHLHPGAVVLRGSVIDKAGGQRSDLALSGDLEYWGYLATFGKWGFIPRVFFQADGTQVAKGNLYNKYFQRYSLCSSVESWQERILPRLKPEHMEGFKKVRGRIATWFVFAKVFAQKDAEAFTTAKMYRDYLEGKFGTLWRIGLFAGWLTWKPLCILMRVRTKIQYKLRSRSI